MPGLALCLPPLPWESKVPLSAWCRRVPSPTAVPVCTPSLAQLLLPVWGPHRDSNTEQLLFSVSLATSGLLVWWYLVIPQSLALAPVLCAQRPADHGREPGQPEHHT